MIELPGVADLRMRVFLTEYQNLHKEAVLKVLDSSDFYFTYTFGNGTEAPPEAIRALKEYHYHMLCTVDTPERLKAHCATYLANTIRKDSICEMISRRHFWLSGHSRLQHYLKNELIKCFKQWRYFSGDCTYPVPSTQMFMSHKGAYAMAHTEGTLWLGKYGELRADLLEFIIRSWNEYR